MARRNSWNLQIFRIEKKGREAFLAGVPYENCPYDKHKNSRAGGNLQRQRIQAWYRGWQLAKDEQGEDENAKSI